MLFDVEPNRNAVTGTMNKQIPNSRMVEETFSQQRHFERKHSEMDKHLFK